MLRRFMSGIRTSLRAGCPSMNTGKKIKQISYHFRCMMDFQRSVILLVALLNVVLGQIQLQSSGEL